MGRHFSFLDTVVRLADGNWGQKHSSSGDAERALLESPEKLAAMATLELVSRFHEFNRRMAGRSQPIRDDELKIDDAPVYPDVSVGDHLYWGDLDDGFAQYRVIATDEHGHCLIVQEHDFDLECPPRVHVAWKSMSSTMADAIKAAATMDIKYHRPRLEFATRALEAAEGGLPLDEFVDGQEE